MSKNFIKLDRQLIRVLGVSQAILLCHLLGIEKTINDKRGKQDAIYQQIDRLSYDIGLSVSTIRSARKGLETLKLLHTIPHTEGNKNKYFIDKNNYNELSKIMDKIENKKVKKNKTSAKTFKRDVLNLYNEYIKNNTTSSDNFSTTNKDLIEKEDKSKNNEYNKTILSNCKHKPITIHYYDSNDTFRDSITYQFIPLFFKDSYTNDDMFDILNNSSNVNKTEHQVLEYFLQKYYQRYGIIHRQATAPKIREILQTIHNVLYDYLDTIGFNDTTNDLYVIMQEVINEYFKRQKNDKDLTIYLFLSNNNGIYSWINTIMKRFI